MTPELVIFDCDGVLIDSEPVTEQLMSDSFAQYGLDLAPHKVASLFTGGTMASAAIEARRLGANLPDTWVSDINAAVAAILRQGVPVFEGLIDLLDACNAAGLATAVASNGPMSKMRASLKPSGLWDRFEGRIYSGHDYKPKPAPDMLHHAMHIARSRPDTTIFIDDSPMGCKAGQAAGVTTFGFKPTGDSSALSDVGAIPVRSMHTIQTKLGLPHASFE